MINRKQLQEQLEQIYGELPPENILWNLAYPGLRKGEGARIL
jgi:hypothetical protein